MQHREVVLGALLPAHEQAPEAVEPGVGALDHPTPGAVAGLVPDGVGLLAAGAKVQGEAELGGEGAGLGVVVALVDAEPLRRLVGRLRTLDDDALDRLAGELVVVAVGAGDGEAERDPAAVCDQAALGALLGSVGGIGPAVFPPSGALVMAPSSARKLQSMPCSAS